VKRFDATVAGVVLIFALAYLDAAWEGTVITATVLIGPFLTAIFAGVRNTALVAAFAVLSAILSGGYNSNYGSTDYFVRLAAVIAGGAFAILAASAMRRLTADQRRFALLRGAAELADTASSIPEVVDRVGELLVPAFADICVIDVLRGDHVERLGVIASQPGASDVEARLRARGSATLEATALVQPVLRERVDEPFLRENARGEDDYEFLRSLNERSHINVPLRSRGRNVGTLALLGVTRSYGPVDLELAQLIAGRIGLALDNAGLFAELEALQLRLTTALDTLAEAVTIQSADQEVLSLNQAARAAFGDTRDIAAQFVSYHEDGTPLRMEELPGRQALAGRTPEPMLIRSINRETGVERWRLVKASAVDGEPRLAVNVIEDVTEVKRAELGQRFLAEAGAVLASGLDHKQTLAKIAELAVPRLADWCSVDMPSGGWLRSVAVAHTDPAKVAFASEYRRRYPTAADAPIGAAQVLRDGTSQLIGPIDEELLGDAIADPEQRDALRGLGMRWVMLVPMVAGPRIIGVISFVSSESGRRFTQADLELAEELGRRAGTAVENARLYQERSHIAATLQRGLLPDELPAIPGLRVASLYRPAGEENLVGGDFYDAFETPTGWMLLVGDVTGRGAEAAALTGQARHTLRTAATLIGDPVAAFEQLNQSLAGLAELTPCTVVLIHVAPDARSATILCAGHPQPLLIRGGEVRSVGRFGPMLGAWVDAHWTADRIELEPGDTLVAFSDGVTDTVGTDGRFGEERLLAALRGAGDAAGAVATIDAALNAFQRGGQTDDTAVLALDIPTA
jgi:serine phosphatase RsbU (regulator of sigma subunit)/PAS domain-containing protein